MHHKENKIKIEKKSHEISLEIMGAGYCTALQRPAYDICCYPTAMFAVRHTPQCIAGNKTIEADTQRLREGGDCAFTLITPAVSTRKLKSPKMKYGTGSLAVSWWNLERLLPVTKQRARRKQEVTGGDKCGGKQVQSPGGGLRGMVDRQTYLSRVCNRARRRLLQ